MDLPYPLSVSSQKMAFCICVDTDTGGAHQCPIPFWDGIAINSPQTHILKNIALSWATEFRFLEKMTIPSLVGSFEAKA